MTLIYSEGGRYCIVQNFAAHHVSMPLEAQNEIDSTLNYFACEEWICSRLQGRMKLCGGLTSGPIALRSDLYGGLYQNDLTSNAWSHRSSVWSAVLDKVLLVWEDQ